MKTHIKISMVIMLIGMVAIFITGDFTPEHTLFIKILGGLFIGLYLLVIYFFIWFIALLWKATIELDSLRYGEKNEN